jgi:endonuclease YncB( thermonuclease family)
MVRGILVLAGLSFVFSGVRAADVNEASYGNAIAGKIIDCNQADGYSFKCDIRNYPPIIGRDISVRIRGVETLTADSNQPQAGQANNFIHENLKNAKRVELKNMQRGDGFFILADVYCDGQNLGQLLVEKNFARTIDDTNGKQRRPMQTKDQEHLFVGSKSSKVFHLPGCRWAEGISEQNAEKYNSRQEAIDRGKRPCKTCKP